MVAQLPCGVPQLEHVLEENVHGGFSRGVVAGDRAELPHRGFGDQPWLENLRPLRPDGTHSALSPGGRRRAASCTVWR